MDYRVELCPTMGRDSDYGLGVASGYGRGYGLGRVSDRAEHQLQVPALWRMACYVTGRCFPSNANPLHNSAIHTVTTTATITLSISFTVSLALTLTYP